MSKGQWNRQRKRVARVSEQSPLTKCTGNGLTDVEASDSVYNVERAAGLKHQHQAVFGLDVCGSCTDHSAGTQL